LKKNKYQKAAENIFGEIVCEESKESGSFSDFQDFGKTQKTIDRKNFVSFGYSRQNMLRIDKIEQDE
jgi:hypothetical protein